MAYSLYKLLSLHAFLHCSVVFVFCYVQYVMKKVDLSKASSKERMAAEQEVWVTNLDKLVVKN